MGKTPDYVKSAIENYRKRYDFLQIRFPKGTVERLREKYGNAVNSYISGLVLADMERLEKPPESPEKVGNSVLTDRPEEPEKQEDREDIFTLFERRKAQYQENKKFYDDSWKYEQIKTAKEVIKGSEGVQEPPAETEFPNGKQA